MRNVILVDAIARSLKSKSSSEFAVRSLFSYVRFSDDNWRMIARTLNETPLLNLGPDYVGSEGEEEQRYFTKREAMRQKSEKKGKEGRRMSFEER